MRKFVMSDMHGQSDAARALLSYAGVDMKKDSMRFLGDYIDRGPKSYQCMKLVLEYQRKGAIVHMGNHEMLLLMWAGGQLTEEQFARVGGEATLKSFMEADLKQDAFERMLRWISELKITDEDDEYFYVHAGVHPHKQNQTTEEFLWIRDEFLYAKPEHILEYTGGKKVVHGHTPQTSVLETDYAINIDLGAGGSRKLALVELTEGIVYEYDFRDLRSFGPDACIHTFPIIKKAHKR